MLEQEEWRPVHGWEGRYEVSDAGRVRSLTIGTSRGRIRTLQANLSGHLRLTLKSKTQRRQNVAFVHVLVLEAFVSPRPDGMVCRHLNGDPTDNRLSNLVWGNMSENSYDQVRHGTHPYARRTHCTNGHEYTVENTYMRGGRKPCRVCRTCVNDAQRRYQRRKAGVAA